MICSTKKIICVECLHTRLLDCRVKWKWYSMFRVARTTVTVNFQVRYQIYFKSIMRCYYVHQSASSSVVGKKLFPNHESSSEAIAYNKFSIRIYWKIKNGSIETEHLVGHAPVEFLSLIFIFSVRIKIGVLQCMWLVKESKKVDWFCHVNILHPRTTYLCTNSWWQARVHKTEIHWIGTKTS